MKYSTLGSSDLVVSRVCLGTMTWGVQNNQQDANIQIDYALNQGVNFIDTAEMYAIPPSAETFGKTELIIGHWLKNNPTRREDFILASKIAGPGLDWVRDGDVINGRAVEEAVNGSLKRLNTDYIDLYQLHWPNRQSPHFGRHWLHQLKFTEVDAEQETAQMLDILQGLDRCIKAGKIRHCGLSDDTPWGIQTYLRLSKEHNLPKMVSIQNEFSLLHTKDWPYLVEQCVHENVAFLPWSPLGGGALTGKYLGGARPDGSRWSLTQRNGIFRDSDNVEGAISAYASIAKQYGYTPAQLALAWCDQVDGVTSTIIGATTVDQLKEDIAAFDMPLTKEILIEITAVMKKYPVPF